MSSNNNWSLKYEYDENGNLKKRTDARAVLTEYTYDDLNRVTFRNYSDSTPDVTYIYDTLANGKGRLTSVGSSASTTTYGGYDVIGRVISSSQVTDGVTYQMPEYRYDLAGNLTSQKYPSGRVVATTYDSAGRLSAVTGQKTNEQDKTYASEVTYTPAGAVKDLRLGNGLWEQTLYNSRLQVEQIRLGTTPGGINRLNLTYDYGTTANNGNVRSQTITVPTVGTTAGFTATQSYNYDALNRLESAEEMSGTTQVWKQSYKYDRFGNRSIDTSLDQNSLKKTSENVQPALLSDNPTLNTSNNQISINQGYGYESAGNLISVPNRADPTKSYKYEYDAENRQISFDRDPATPNTKDASYIYDGDGRRVMKVADGVKTVFVYDVAGKLVAEYSSAGSAGGGTSYLTSDTLGTPRVITGSDITDASGGVKARHDYMPFGEELFVGRSNYVGDNIRQKFTQKERDVETGLDYFGARYYTSTQGRFTSVDPINIESRHLLDPQDLNRYSYVANNPFKFIDPTGEEKIKVFTRTFIPQKTIIAPNGERAGTMSTKIGPIPLPMTPMQRRFRGDDRNVGATGTYRTEHLITIETDPNANGGNPVYLNESIGQNGVTRELDFQGKVIAQVKGSGKSLAFIAWRDNGVVRIRALGNERDPLVTGAPGITYEFGIGVHSSGTKGNVFVSIAGGHDAFPAYEVIIERPDAPNNAPAVIYGYDPRDTGSTPDSLFPPVDILLQRAVTVSPEGRVRSIFGGK